MDSSDAATTEQSSAHIPLENCKLIKQGAEARIYYGLYKENNRNSIVKERFKKTYRHSDLDKSLTKKRIKNEVKLLKKASSLGKYYLT